MSTMGTARPVRTRVLAATAVLLMTAAACGDAGSNAPDVSAGNPAETSDGDGSGRAEANPRIDEILAEIDGLDVDARRERLLELAEEEGGQLNWYGSTSLEDLNVVAEAFQEATGIEVSTYRALTDTVLQRVMEEINAGYAGADVLGIGGFDLSILSNEGLLVPIDDTPAATNVPEEIRQPDWIPTQLTVSLPAWNTNAFPDPPGSLMEILEDHRDRITFEVRQHEWFATIVIEHLLMGQEGMSEEEAIDYMREVAQDARAVQGAVTAASLLGAGEFDLVLPIHQHVTERIGREGAPIAWQPVIEPALALPTGAGIPVTSQNPAAALLWVDFYLTEGQVIMEELGRTIVDSTLDSAIPEGTEIILTDFERWNDPAETEKWEGIYEEVLRGLDVAS